MEFDRTQDPAVVREAAVPFDSATARPVMDRVVSVFSYSHVPAKGQAFQVECAYGRECSTGEQPYTRRKVLKPGETYTWDGGAWLEGAIAELVVVNVAAAPAHQASENEKAVRRNSPLVLRVGSAVFDIPLGGFNAITPRKGSVITVTNETDADLTMQVSAGPL